MNSYTDSAIYKLINLEDFFRKARPADAAEWQRWTKDTYACLTERYKVGMLDEKYNEILLTALKEWNDDRQVSFYFSEYFGNPENFLAWFSALRMMMIDKAKIPPRFSRDDHDGDGNPIYPPTSLVAETVNEGFREDASYLYRFALEQSRNLVANIAWCEYFGVLLPQAVTDAGLRRRVATTGASMSAIFYLERVSKWLDKYEGATDAALFKTNDPDFEKVDDCWRLAMNFRSQT